jgi:glutathione-specific gamma-glutamylcyclotransferase
MLDPLLDAEPALDEDPCRPLSREDLQHGGRRDAYIRKLLGGAAWSEAQLQASLERVLHHAPRGDVWIFAYGSLIWNPLFPVAEERVARVHGLHRSFCIWSRLGRGSPDRPGLVLGLNRGGNCRGVVLRLEEHHAREELALIWRREMVTGAYRPKWVKATTAHGVVDAIAFVADRKAEGYAGDLTEAEVVDILRTGAGFLGTCSEYLAQTTAGLAARGIRDEGLHRLARVCGCAASAPTSKESLPA